MNLRMLAPTSVAHQARVVNGRPYQAATGTVITVPEQDGRVLEANGWSVIALSAPTAGRPKSMIGLFTMRRGTLLWDETLGAMIVSDGKTWRSVATGAPA